MGNIRNTIQRDETLQAVRRLHNHPTAEEVYAEVISRNPHISKGTVYRNLGMLSDSGEIKKLLMPGNVPDRYDGDLYSHCHAICRRCGRVFDIDYCKDALPEVNSNGFKVEDYEILFTGLCKECKDKE